MTFSLENIMMLSWYIHYIIDIFVPTLVLIRARVLAVTRADRQSQQPTLGVACAWEMKRNVRDSQITHRRHTSITKSRSLNPLEFKGNYGAALNIWSWCTGRWWGGGCNIWYSEEGNGRGPSPPRPLLAVPNVTAHPSTASVPVTVRCSAVLMCTSIKGLRTRQRCPLSDDCIVRAKERDLPARRL